MIDPRELFHDEHLLAIDKPSGMLVHRGWDDDAATALAWARGRAGRRVFPVHRLDRGTSGVLLFALSPEAARALAGQLAEGRVEKRYLALVRGQPADEGTIDHALRRGEEKDSPRVPALTAYRRLATASVGAHRYSLVAAMPRTGRLHQVRRHLKHLGHPIIGDVNYGKGEHNRLFRERFGLARLALHAAEVVFAHPLSGETLRLQAPLPDDLAGPLNLLGLL